MKLTGKAVDKDELPWLNLRDPNGRESIVQYQYGNTCSARQFLVGPEGNILAKNVTPAELSQILQDVSANLNSF